MPDNTLLNCARYYTEKLGLRIFPCNGKIPAFKGEHGCLDATTDPTMINKWWKGGNTYNIGVATGNGLVVLDVDIDHNSGRFGDETLADLEQQYGPLPETWMCLTGGGGVHYYFACSDPALTVAVGFAPGLDYKGTGGYVIAPPSIHPETGRAYEWEVNHRPDDTELAPLPEWLHRLMLRGSKDKTEQTKRNDVPEKIAKGQRNDEIFRLASSLRAKSLTVMKAVQGDSGHAQMKMVADVYSHIIDEDRCINAQRFEDAFYSQAKAPEPAIQEIEEKETGTTTPESDTAKILELLKNPETAALLKQIVSAL